MDTLDFTQDPYRIFKPTNIYGGIPPFEVVVYQFDRPEFSDYHRYPFYPVYNSDTNSYELMDRIEVDGTPEIQRMINKYRVYNKMNASGNVPNWITPIRYHEENSDEDSEYSLDDDELEMAEANRQFQEYVRQSDLQEVTHSSDAYSDPLDSFRSLMSNPLTASAPFEFFDQLIGCHLSENKSINTRSFQQDLTENVLKTVVKLKLAEPVDDLPPDIVNTSRTYLDYQPEELKFTTIASVLQLAGRVPKLDFQINGHNQLRKFRELAKSNFIIEEIGPYLHNKYYFKNDADINDLIRYILEGNINFQECLLNIIQGKYRFSNSGSISPDYRPRSPNLDDFEMITYTANEFHGFTFPPGSPFQTNHTKLVKLFSFCISYLACRVDKFQFEDVVSSEVLLKMRISADKKSDLFTIYRKRYNFVFFSSHYKSAILNLTKSVFR
jgi:hypothetical protein